MPAKAGIFYMKKTPACAGVTFFLGKVYDIRIRQRRMPTKITR